ncbi:hypothetical protein RUM43_004158 [Polyplax serrata]|uniref:DNA methyltransferase 1-associated protein 1 n=1 Tax=Polyplax serrata TaxID=468196 RepID=A0AAN8XMQ8_POLSC
MVDVRDILDLERSGTPELTKELILGNADKNRKKPVVGQKQSKRPEGMHREVFALLYNDNKDAPPLFPTDTGQGYKQMKAKLGMKKVRPWKWMPFTNPARTDGAIFHHWRRVADEGKEYPFARFNKKVNVPTYQDNEYIPAEGWSRQETDHLFDLCRRFDLRFNVICDRWDRNSYPNRSIEDLKERYYSFCSALNKLKVGVDATKMYVFDADHERRRKEQLKRLFERTPEQIEEEQMLLNELRKIDARKREREKKTQDLQKLITAADNQAEARSGEKKVQKKKVQQARPTKIDTTSIESAGIKFPDFKGHGTSLRSQRMKLPVSVGQKKSKAIESLLHELGLELNPMPTEETCQHFNELRSDMVLLYELKAALANCEFELQSLRHQYEALNPGKTLAIPSSIIQPTSEEATKHKLSSSEIIDVVGSPGTPSIN